MRQPPKPIVVPATYRARSLPQQIEDVSELLHDLDEGERRGRYHPEFAAFRRHKLKSVLQTLQGLQPATNTPASADLARATQPTEGTA